MKKIALSKNEKSAFSLTMDYVRDWCSEHQWELGVAEMAAGAAIISYGVHNGAIEMGKGVVATAFRSGNLGEKIGGIAGAGLGGVGGAVIGSIGVVAMGGAVGIPALAMVGGGSFILGACGYTAGDLVHKFLSPPVKPSEFLAGCSVLAVGTALLLDGARRVVVDKRVRKALSSFKDGTIYLAGLTGKVVARSLHELKGFVKDLAKLPETPTDAAGSVLAGTGMGLAGAAAGSAAASASVTVMGSQALGGLGLSLGLLSAPVWPVIAGGATGIACGYIGWKACRKLGHKLVRY